MAISWHRDPQLVPMSTIAVYSFNPMRASDGPSKGFNICATNFQCLIANPACLLIFFNYLYTILNIQIGNLP